ncbi:proline racemase family protein [Saccharopolyspora shandongensis]|uniref:proline racemase family protein n=1 Tax=Saccharopolyspora shandongensis TaxID=418495 RepID=UPI0033F0AEF7
MIWMLPARLHSSHPTPAPPDTPISRTKPIEAPTSRGTVRADIAYGGAFHAAVENDRLGLKVTPSKLPQLIALSEIKKESSLATT